MLCTVQYTSRPDSRRQSWVQRPIAEQPVVGRSARKRQAILHAARGLFLKKGYAGTSMDEVAAMAEVSKVTIYKHFSDKHTLFIAVVTAAIDEAKAGSQSLVDQLGNSTDIELDLGTSPAGTSSL